MWFTFTYPFQIVWNGIFDNDEHKIYKKSSDHLTNQN